MNPVLEESGPLSLSRPAGLTHSDGAVTTTRASAAFIPEEDDIVRASGWNVWAPTPANASAVVSILVDLAGGGSWTFGAVLYAERTTGTLLGPAGMDTTRYQVCEPAVAAAPVGPVDPAAGGDFDPADFAAADYLTDG